jgi:ABC-type transport system involved in multi-copper enzyme maturation permease subunit
MYEYLHGIGFVILLLIFGMIFVVFGVGLSVEETVTGERVTLFGQDIFRGVSDANPIFRDVGAKQPAALIQFSFVMAAVSFWGPMFFILIGSRVLESMLSQGNRHLLLSKPMHRYHLFLSRLGSFMLFSAVVVYLFLGGLWLIIGIKTGCFLYQPFVAAPVVLLIYLSLLSVIALVTVLIENFFVAAGATVAFYFVTTILAQVGSFFEGNSALYSGWYMLHGCLPRIAELSDAIVGLYLETPSEWFTPIWATALFSAVVLAVACFLFWRKEY